MSSSDRVRPRLAGLLALILLGGCTVSPLYGTSSRTDLAAGQAGLSLGDLRGQIGVGVANTRTAQLFRNALLFRLNGGTTPTAPAYEIRYGVVGVENVVSIERGSGVPAASLYDRSAQLFAASRALIDARELAARAVAEKVELAAVVAIRKDLGK
jgi:LPS-assembly lipoprotein